MVFIASSNTLHIRAAFEPAGRAQTPETQKQTPPIADPQVQAEFNRLRSALDHMKKHPVSEQDLARLVYPSRKYPWSGLFDAKPNVPTPFLVQQQALKALGNLSHAATKTSLPFGLRASLTRMCGEFEQVLTQQREIARKIKTQTSVQSAKDCCGEVLEAIRIKADHLFRRAEQRHLELMAIQQTWSPGMPQAVTSALLGLIDASHRLDTSEPLTPDSAWDDPTELPTLQRLLDEHGAVLAYRAALDAAALAPSNFQTPLLQWGKQLSMQLGNTAQAARLALKKDPDNSAIRFKMQETQTRSHELNQVIFPVDSRYSAGPSLNRPSTSDFAENRPPARN